MKMKNVAIGSISILFGVALVAGCGKKETAEEQPAAPAPAAAAGAAAGAGAAGCSSAVSFLPHPATRATPKRIEMLPIATFFIFICSTSLLKYQKFIDARLLLRRALRGAARAVGSRGTAACGRPRASH